jgi:ORF6N domain
MKLTPMTQIIPKPENLAKLVFLIRGEKVLLDTDLADLYGVETGALNRAVKRNIDRFPADFMLQLTPQEWENLKCQIGISSEHGGRRAIPYAFTEQGVAMLSSVLRSQRAVEVNIAIMRIPAFMYLTDFRENTLQDVITKLEPELFLTVTGLTVQDFHLLVRLKVFNTEQMNAAVFAFRRYEDASLRYTGIASHESLTHYGLYDTVVAKD